MPCSYCKTTGHNIRKCNNRTGEFVSIFGNKYTYKGQIKNDKPHGLGKANYENGNKYEGEYKDGKANGHGVETMANGDKYDGEWKDGKKHGHGVMTLAGGYKYDGEFKDDNMNGHGVYTDADGDKYDGEFKDNNQHGHGVYTGVDGTKYDGEFKDGNQHGHGVLTKADGSKYDGEWKDGKKHGEGVLTNACGEKYKGKWADDKKCIKIESIDDLLNILDTHPLESFINHIRVRDINNIKEPLLRLKNMIGMKRLKDMVFDQLIYFFQGLHKTKEGIKNKEYMHTVIYGPPGTGKTEFAKIIGELFCKLKILPKNKFKKATRTDFVGNYLGQTANKTNKLITECLGGVLFIDEAYALGNKDGKDIYAKECIDTICEALSDKRGELMVIIAGYEEELDKCFFSYNSGLKSRFPWKYVTDNYNYENLYSIFVKMVKDIGWELHNGINSIWFDDKIDDFKYFGRDIETLLSKVKITHSRRVFCLNEENKRLINIDDLNNGYGLFLENK